MKKSMGKALLLCALAAGSMSLTGCGSEGGGGNGGGGGGPLQGIIKGLLRFVPQIGDGGGRVASGGPINTPVGGGGTGFPGFPGLPQDVTQWFPTTKTATEIGGPDVPPVWREGEAEPLVPGPEQGTYDQDPWPLDYPTSGAAGPGGGSWNEGEPEPVVQQPYEPEGDEV